MDTGGNCLKLHCGSSRASPTGEVPSQLTLYRAHVHAETATEGRALPKASRYCALLLPRCQSGPSGEGGHGDFHHPSLSIQTLSATSWAALLVDAERSGQA